MEWVDLLFDTYNYEKEGKRLFPINPPDPMRCKSFQRLLEDIYFQVWKNEKGRKIVIRDHGIADYNLPMVTVMEADGTETALDGLTRHELLSLPIVLETDKRMTNGQMITLLAFYTLYPLRAARQKKRDSIAMILNVFCQHLQKESL